MAACGSLQHIFENPLPENNPTLLESLSPWKAIKNMKPSVENSNSLTEIFGELHFNENNQVHSSASSSSSSSSSLPDQSSPSIDDDNSGNYNNERSKSPTSSNYPSSSPAAARRKHHYKHSDSFSSMNSESLSLCTEGLGFESSDDVEDLGINNEEGFDFQQPPEEKMCFSRQTSQQPDQIQSTIWKESKRSSSSSSSSSSRWNKGSSFPPPISCIGRTGKPWVCFKSYRQDGRFILQEIRFPIQEFLHACREDGRLRLQYIQSDDEILEGDEEEEEEDDDDDDGFEDIEEVNEENELGDGFAGNYHEQGKEYDNGEPDDSEISKSNVQG